MRRRQKSSKKLLILAIISIVLVIASGLLVALEKFGVTDLYQVNEPLTNTTPDSTITQSIDYSPATTTDNEDINQKKTSGQLVPDIPTTTTIEKSIDVSLTAAGQDTPNGPLVVRALITSVSSGQCTLTLTRTDTTKTYTSSVVLAGTYYTCEGFDIPIKDLSPGQWQIGLTVVSGDQTGKVSQTTEVKF